MSDVIQLLPDSVANQIAAGEVVQRPASVVKELMENSIDAGATKIDLVLMDAGRTLIQVIDNGKGMSETDARMAFERHATSKIREAQDLFKLHTMGFRGEALPSIASVAQVELRTRTADSVLGTAIIIAGNELQSQEQCNCPVGSNFMVSNLFYNVPARRRFLKSNATEMNNILSAFERIALIYPDIHFTVTSNGNMVHNLPPSTRKQRITAIFGKTLDPYLMPIEVDTTLCKISGFVGKSECSRKKENRQFFFVNGRYMKHPYFHKAVLTAFERLLPEGEQVPYFIYFDIDPSSIDVNIHPTKTEIKFENERDIWQVLMATIRNAVGQYIGVPSIDFDTEGKLDIPLFEPADTVTNIEMPQPTFDTSYNPFEKTRGRQQGNTPKNWDTLFSGLEKREEPLSQEQLFEDESDEIILDSKSTLIEEKSPTHYQYKGQYIMTAVKSGLMIIDQHRAHVRILYDEYVEKVRNKKISIQQEMFPIHVQFSPSEAALMDSLKEEFTELGFSIVKVAEGEYEIQGVPSGTVGLDYPSMLKDMLEAVKDQKDNVREQILNDFSLAMAKKVAIPTGQILHNEEMESIVNGLFSSSNASMTPDGKPIMCILPQKDIEGMF